VHYNGTSRGFMSARAHSPASTSAMLMKLLVAGEEMGASASVRPFPPGPGVRLRLQNKCYPGNFDLPMNVLTGQTAVPHPLRLVRILRIPPLLAGARPRCGRARRPRPAVVPPVRLFDRCATRQGASQAPLTRRSLLLHRYSLPPARAVPLAPRFFDPRRRSAARPSTSWPASPASVYACRLQSHRPRPPASPQLSPAAPRRPGS